jgi:hypothetical protein
MALIGCEIVAETVIKIETITTNVNNNSTNLSKSIILLFHPPFIKFLNLSKGAHYEAQRLATNNESKGD